MLLKAIERDIEPDGSAHYRTDIIRDPSRLEPAFLAHILGVSLEELKTDLGVLRGGPIDTERVVSAVRLAASEKPLGQREPGERTFVNNPNNGSSIFSLMDKDRRLHRRLIIQTCPPVNNQPLA